MKLGFLLSAIFVLAAIGAPAAAGPFFWQQGENCYFCLRDAIYEDVRLIARLEANPDIDEAVKGPQITAARVDIRRLRALLGPLQPIDTAPCCYARQPLRVR